MAIYYDQSSAIQILDRVNQNKALRKKADKLREKYTTKPKVEADKPLIRLAMIGKFIFSFISIALAFYFMQTLFLQATKAPELSLAFASITLVFIEFLKHSTLPRILNNYFTVSKHLKEKCKVDYQFRGSEPYHELRASRLKIGFLLFNVGLVLLSVFLSVRGIEMYNQEKLAVKPILIDTDSLDQTYDAKIERTAEQYRAEIKKVRSEQEAFKASVSWKGKINMYNEGNRKLLEGYSVQIKDLQDSKERALSHLRDEKDNAFTRSETINNGRLQSAQVKTAQTGLYLVGFASISEVGCIICLWFLCLTDFRAYQELMEAEKRAGLRKSAAPSPTLSVSRPETSLISRKAKTKKQEKILELYEKGMAKIDIHRALGVSRSTIDRTISTYGN